MKELNRQKIKEVNKFRSLFPSKISVNVSRTDEGEFLASIDTLHGFITEGNNFSELIEMVNDAVKTYFEIPKKFIPYMPNYVPPIEVAQQLDIFPVRKIAKTIIMPLDTRERTAR